MPRAATCLSVPALALGALSGCIVPAAPPTTVELVNSTSLDVRPNLYASASATDAAGLFVGANLITNFTQRPFPELRPGESVSLDLECNRVQSLGVDAPVSFDAAQLVVTTSQDRIFLQQGPDFQCGATVRFVYFTEGGSFRVRAEYP